MTVKKNNKKNQKRTELNGKSNDKFKDKNKKTLKFLAIGVIIALVLFLISWTLLFLKQSLILSEQDINVTMGVSDYIGLNKDTDKLHMGTTFPGGKMFAHMNVSSARDGYLFVTCSSGNETQILEWLYLSSQGEQVVKDEVTGLSFEGRPAPDAVFGRYESTLHFYIVKNDKLSFFEKLYIKGHLLTDLDDVSSPVAEGIGGKIVISIANQSKVNGSVNYS